MTGTFLRWRSFEATTALGQFIRPVAPIVPDTTQLDISLANGIAMGNGPLYVA